MKNLSFKQLEAIANELEASLENTGSPQDSHQQFKVYDIDDIHVAGVIRSKGKYFTPAELRMCIRNIDFPRY